MQPYYPAIKTYATHCLQVGPIHELYIEECGNPDGLPVVVVHSGPGGGVEPFQRRFFDPEQYRIILFDQRGAGRSRPHAELRDNSTQKLIADLERIRDYLKIESWVMLGGAWGCSLSLLYAQAYPQHVRSLIVYSVFLAREQDMAWFYQNGANKFFPDYWEEFTSGFSDEEKQDLVIAYQKRLNQPDELARMATAKAWSSWQAQCSALQPHGTIIDHFSDPHVAVGLANIECHYLVNNFFIKSDQILKNMKKIQQIPGYIIHGRYDMVCPLKNAWELNQAWPNSNLYIVRDAGHSAKEPGIIDALIVATRKVLKTQPRPAC